MTDIGLTSDKVGIKGSPTYVSKAFRNISTHNAQIYAIINIHFEFLCITFHVIIPLQLHYYQYTTNNKITQFLHEI